MSAVRVVRKLLGALGSIVGASSLARTPRQLALYSLSEVLYVALALGTLFETQLHVLLHEYLRGYLARQTCFYLKKWWG